MARQITVDLVSDTKAFERSMASSAAATSKFESELKSADAAASRFDGAMEKTTGSLENSTSKFRSSADLAGGLGDVMGVAALGPISQYATGMADIADGLGGLLAPALGKAKAAFLAMNATLLANPIFLVIAALAALTVGFVIAYKKSETFRNIVNGALHAVTDGVKAFVNYTVDAVTEAAKVLGKVADIITTPYQIAFKAIAELWNHTVGALHVSIPGFLGFGGVSFDVPDIPMLAKGGQLRAGQPGIVGENGPELFIPRMGGTVVPNGAAGRVEVVLVASSDDLWLRAMAKSIRVRGGNVQSVLGSG